jgi:N-acylneuraminate cytidylyltransferase
MIPLRGGSKGIPGKNRRKVLGRPLFSWSLSEAIFSRLDKVYVYTDDPQIMELAKKEYQWTEKVEVLERSEESATDTASTEFAMWELAERINHDYDIFCLIQATSPLITREDINKTLDKLEKEAYDSALTVVESGRFFWSKDGDSLNYDYMNRPRRQDFDGTLMENGAFYAIKKEMYHQTKNRLGGNIGVVKMPEDTLTEIDEPSDLIICESLLINRLKKLKGTPQSVKLVVFDVDGVFTNGNIVYSTDGEFSKEFNMQDGMGFELLRQENIPAVIMTSEDTEIVSSRMQKLKIDNVQLGVKDKFARIEKLLLEYGITRSEVVYVGDDINDLANIVSVGWGIAPNNAVDEVKNSADIVLNKPGGAKAVREAVEFIIQYNQRFK